MCRRFTPEIEAALRTQYELSVNDDDSILPSATIVERARGAQVLFVSATERIDAPTIEALAKDLRAIATLSVGYDHIDLTAARAHGIKVLHTPDVLSGACAEIALMLMLNACRRGFEADSMVREGRWPGWAPTQLLGKGLVGARLGIFGMGRIGREIARRAKGFEMEIHYHNRNRLAPALEDGAIYHPEFDALVASSDVLMIAAPGAPESKGLFNAEKIALLPAGAVVVNISRGDIVDDDALIAALRSGRVAAAGLDVFANEPCVDPRYSDLPNTFLTPHIGSATRETRNAMANMLIDGLVQLGRGETPTNQIA